MFASFQDPNFTLDEQRATTTTTMPSDVGRRRRLYSLGDLDTHKEESGPQRIPTPPIVIKISDQVFVDIKPFFLFFLQHCLKLKERGP